jgi:hypothetical protein
MCSGTSIQQGMPSIKFDPLNFNIPKKRYMTLGSDLGQDISTLWGIWCILRSQLKNMFLMDSLSILPSQPRNRFQLHKLSDMLRLLDIQSQLGREGIMSNLIGSDILKIRCKALGQSL